MSLATMDGDLVFSGLWTSLSLICENNYQEARDEADTFSLLVDWEKKMKTFQSRTLKFIQSACFSESSLVE